MHITHFTINNTTVIFVVVVVRVISQSSPINFGVKFTRLYSETSVSEQNIYKCGRDLMKLSTTARLSNILESRRHRI